MCKIVTFTDASNLDTLDVAEKIGNLLLQTEQDGFGYAVQAANGVYGEKCIDSIFAPRINLDAVNPPDAIVQKYQSFGRFSKATGPMILHGRTSTNYLGLRNCHPMIDKDNYLIHNGVVTDSGPDYKRKTQTDSEDVLHRFLEGISSVEKHLEGYYAFSCIDSNGKLHIVRDRIATLHMAWLSKYKTYVIATTANLILQIAGKLQCDVSAIDEIQPDVYLVFNKNKMEKATHIKSLGYSYRQARHATKSLGRTLDDTDDEPNVLDMTSDASIISHHLTRDEFEKAIEYIDDTWDILGPDDNFINLDEFRQLDPIAQRQCWFTSPDGYDFCYEGSVA